MCITSIPPELQTHILQDKLDVLVLYFLLKEKKINRRCKLYSTYDFYFVLFMLGQDCDIQIQDHSSKKQ